MKFDLERSSSEVDAISLRLKPCQGFGTLAGLEVKKF